MKRTLSILLLTLAALDFAGAASPAPKTPSVGSATPGIKSFSTGGHTIYHARAATVAKGSARAVIAASQFGKLLCYTMDGKKLWERDTGGSFPFDMDVGDIDGDGLDEACVASADGSLHAVDHDGKPLWKVLEDKPPLYQVSILQSGRETAIFAGGVEKVLYKIGTHGKAVGKVPGEGIVRNIGAGAVIERGAKHLVVVRRRAFKPGTLEIYDPVSLKLLTESRKAVGKDSFEMLVRDTDADGIEEIILGFRTGAAAYDANGEEIARFEPRRGRKAPDTYEMMLLSGFGSDPAKGILGLSASWLIRYGPDGKNRSERSSCISPTSISYDEATGTVILGSAISGGDCIHLIDARAANWMDAYAGMEPKGRIGEVIENIRSVRGKIRNFNPPAYQPKSEAKYLIVSEAGRPFNPSKTAELDPKDSEFPLAALHGALFPYDNVAFSANRWFTDNRDRSALPHGWARKRDQRMTYSLTKEEIIGYASKMESLGVRFMMTAGHGNDPLFMGLGTIEAILQAAPRTCDGFIFPEMERTDEGMKWVIDNHIRPICDLCLKYGKKKLVLRSKHAFWSCNAHLPLWREVIMSRKYKEVIVPAMEETNERAPDLSISGRLGLYLTGYCAQWAARAVRDNLSFNRYFEWGTGMVGSHFLRALVYRASLGADMFLIQLGSLRTGTAGESSAEHGRYVHERIDLKPPGRASDLSSGGANQGHLSEHGVFCHEPFVHMLGKGVIYTPKDRSDILSISPVAVGIMDPGPDYIRHGCNGHHIEEYVAGEAPLVFDRLDNYWAQAPTAAHDIGSYGAGRTKQAHNFLPLFPYGLITFLPAREDISKIPRLGAKFDTDGKSWFIGGVKRGPAEAKPDILRALGDRASALPVRVHGEAAWTAVRIDDRHIRLTLLDPGYLSPAERRVSVTFSINARRVTDILDRKELEIRDGAMAITIPAGIFRIIDIEHEPRESGTERGRP